MSFCYISKKNAVRVKVRSRNLCAEWVTCICIEPGRVMAKLRKKVEILPFDINVGYSESEHAKT